MRLIRILISLMLSIFLGNTMAYGVGQPDAGYAVAAVLFTGGFIIPSIPGVLGSYITVDVSKAAVPMPGFEPPKDQIIVIRARDVLVYPNRDSKGVVVNDNIIMKPGAIMMRLDTTAGTIVYKGTAEGDADSRGVLQSIEAEVPGYHETISEFMANNMNEDLYVILQFCDGSIPKLFGTPCAKMQMKPEFEGNKDKTFSKLTFESMNKGPVVALYKGSTTFATDFVIAADDTTPSIADGEGRYVVPSDNSVATEITSFDDATVGHLITLVGSGGTYPSTIADGGKFILVGGAAWSSDDGATITFKVFDADHFIEQSRTA